MKILLNVLFFVVLYSFAQADEKKITRSPAEYAGCGESELVKTAKLSCVYCGLKKINRPLPDDNYLAMMGLLVREKTDLFEDEKKHVGKHSRRRPLSSDYSHPVPSKSGTVIYSASTIYQKSVLKMLLSAGYCSPGKVKSKSPDTMYKHFASRIDSDKYPEYAQSKKEKADGDKSEEDKHETAVKELGFSSWDKALDSLWIDGTGKVPFFTRSFENQKESYKNIRSREIGKVSSRAIRRGETAESSDIYNCLQDIEQNYAPTYFSNEKANEACNAIYDECKIATDESGNIRRSNKARVGGDFCDDQYKLATAPVLSATPKEGSDNKSNVDPAGKNAVRSDGTPLAPVEDKSFRSMGNGLLMSHDGKVIDEQGNSLDTRKVIQNKDGSITIPKDAWVPKITVPDSKAAPTTPPK